MAHNLAQDATVRAHRAAAAAAASGEILGLEATCERDFSLGYCSSAKVSTCLPTNALELERLRALKRRALVGKTDFSPMSRSQLANEKSHVCFSVTAETASPR